MREEQIQKQLAQHLIKQEVCEQPEHIDDTSIHDGLSSNLPLEDLNTKLEVMELLGIPDSQKQSDETKSITDYIIKWAMENSPSNEKTEIIETIYKQLRMMGAELKEDKLQRIYRFAKLSNQRKVIEMQMRSL